MCHPLKMEYTLHQTVLPLEKGELEGDENPLNPKILRKERHVKHTSTLLGGGQEGHPVPFPSGGDRGRF